MDGSAVRQKTYSVNGEEQSIEAEGVEISVYGAITSFSCSSNQLTMLDVSKNTALTYLYCVTNQITALDVSKNTALTELNCGGNKLKELDLSKNTALTELICGGNKLKELDLSKNTALTLLDCSDNQFTTLDVSKNTAMNKLFSDRIPTITTLSIASNYVNASVSKTLAKLITDATSTTGTLNIYGGDNTTVHTAATTKGWTVNTNL